MLSTYFNHFVFPESILPKKHLQISLLLAAYFMFVWHVDLKKGRSTIVKSSYKLFVKAEYLQKLHYRERTLQPKTGCPLKQSWAVPGQYLDGRPPVKIRLLLEEMLVRPAGGAHPVVCVGHNAPEYWRGHYTVKKHRFSDETLNRGPDSLWSLKIPWHFL